MMGWKTGFHNLFFAADMDAHRNVIGKRRSLGYKECGVNAIIIFLRNEGPASPRRPLPGRSRQRIFQKQRCTHSHDVATLVCRALWKEN